MAKRRLIRTADEKQDTIAELLKQMSNSGLFHLAKDLDEVANTKFVDGIVENNDDEIERLLSSNNLSLASAFAIGVNAARKGWYSNTSPYVYMHDDLEIESIDEDYVKTLISNSDSAMMDFVNAIVAHPNLDSIPQEIKDVING